MADIIGVFVLFQYGLPEDLDRGGRPIIISEDDPDEAEVRKGRHYDRMGRVGLSLLIAGFVFQLAAIWLPR